jgi:hypothetical protein
VSILASHNRPAEVEHELRVRRTRQPGGGSLQCADEREVFHGANGVLIEGENASPNRIHVKQHVAESPQMKAGAFVGIGGGHKRPGYLTSHLGEYRKQQRVSRQNRPHVVVQQVQHLKLPEDRRVAVGLIDSGEIVLRTD